MLAGIASEPVNGQAWEMRLLEEDVERKIGSYTDNLYPVRHGEKTVYDHVEVQTKVERAFACACDDDERVRFFVKLPKTFTVDTPIGTQNPDRAISVTNDPERLYLVSETKGSTDEGSLRSSEKRKIDCARKHFQALDVDYEVASSLRDALRFARPAQSR